MLNSNDSTSEWVTLLVMFDKSKTKGNIEHQTKWNLKKNKKVWQQDYSWNIFKMSYSILVYNKKFMHVPYIYIKNGSDL